MSEPTSIVKVAVTVADEVIRIYSLFDMGKSLIEIYKDKHNTLENLFIRAFKQAVDDVSKQYTNDSTKSFLENCREIGDVYGCESLYNYLCKINNDMKVKLKDNELENISNEITEQLNCIVLNDNEYKDLYNVFSYYQLNSISFKLDKLDNIMQEFIKLIDDHNELRSDNGLFARAYKERLFMHAVGDISISLSDIFVIPDVKNNYTVANALLAIRNFINDNDQHVFFLEGFGGYGKSSIVSYLAYNYLFNRLSPNIDFLNNRQLVIIRLRDIDSNNIIKDIIDKLNNIGKLSKNAVLIFDGLDELCLIENRSDGNNISESIISEFLKDNRKIIITSRPTYIKYRELRLARNVNYLKAEIVAFNEKKLKKFVDLFALKDNSRPSTIEYIRELNFEDNDFNNIYSSPFLLYLIMSGGIEEDEKNNLWKLLHRIFYREMFKPMYSPNVRKLNKDDIDKIYQYNCDIAYEMFKTQNQKLSFTYDELSELLPEYNSDTHNFYEYIKKSHGLFSYMRYNNEGAVEFVHNHIRDFFLCEKILITMSEWYKNSHNSEDFVRKLGNLLKYSHFEQQVKQFIKEALKNNYKCITAKCTAEHLPDIFDLFHNADGMINYDYLEEIKSESSDFSFSQLSSNVIGNASFIYKNIYLDKGEKYIKWFNVHVQNLNVIKMMSLNLYKADLSYLDLFGVDLRGADLRGANLRGTNLREANLSNSDLCGVDLSKANLIRANLSEANSNEANLREADLSRTNLRLVNFTGADFSEANLNVADLSGANLRGANLYKANLKKSYLLGADLSGANLMRTDFSEANLIKADLSGTNLHDILLYDEKTDELYFMTNYIFQTKYNKNTRFPEGFILEEPEWIYVE